MRRGIQTAEMAEQNRRKSGFIMQGRLAKETGRFDESARFFAEAALLEESLADQFLHQGIVEQAGKHRFSAVGCWSQAGNYHRTLELCDFLLNSTDIPPTLQAKVASYAQTVRTRRDRLWAEILDEEKQLVPL